jgi:hypothetical protein
VYRVGRGLSLVVQLAANTSTKRGNEVVPGLLYFSDAVCAHSANGINMVVSANMLVNCQ